MFPSTFEMVLEKFLKKVFPGLAGQDLALAELCLLIRSVFESIVPRGSRCLQGWNQKLCALSGPAWQKSRRMLWIVASVRLFG